MRDEGIEAAYRLRIPAVAERARTAVGREFLEASGQADLWKQYAQVLLSSNEFAYVD